MLTILFLSYKKNQVLTREWQYKYSACPLVIRISEPMLTFSEPNGILIKLSLTFSTSWRFKNVAANFEH